MFGSRVAFGVPGVLMALAVFVFWLGRHHYVSVPPTGPRKDRPARVLWRALFRGRAAARAEFGEPATDAAFAVVRVGLVLLPIVAFWALFDQTGSSWVRQAERMALHGLQPDQLQALNPLFVMAIIPLLTLGAYPWFERRGVAVTPLRRITVGMFLTAVSFVAAGVLEVFTPSVTVTDMVSTHLRHLLDIGVAPATCQAIYEAFYADPVARISVLWQIVPYLILTAAEVLVSITGLEFAYTQAPRSMKSTIMSLWLMTTAFGNLLTASVARANVFDGAGYFAFWAVLMTVFSCGFALIARSYRVVEYIEPDVKDY
jgi:POT family proton-dependent oligopeptide transporter